MSATIDRTTKETSITLTLDPAGGERRIETPTRFLGHMLDAFATHGRFALSIDASGDVDVDQHHLVEDLGIVLGEALAKIVGDGAGVQRAGFFRMPMDEALCEAAVDFCGRGTLVDRVALRDRFVGDLDADALREFWKGLVRSARCSLHLDLVRAENDHHAVEASFKAFGRAVQMALTPVEPGQVVSSKGAL